MTSKKTTSTQPVPIDVSSDDEIQILDVRQNPIHATFPTSNQQSERLSGRPPMLSTSFLRPGTSQQTSGVDFRQSSTSQEVLRFDLLQPNIRQEPPVDPIQVFNSFVDSFGSLGQRGAFNFLEFPIGTRIEPIVTRTENGQPIITYRVLAPISSSGNPSPGASRDVNLSRPQGTTSSAFSMVSSSVIPISIPSSAAGTSSQPEIIDLESTPSPRSPDVSVIEVGDENSANFVHRDRQNSESERALIQKMKWQEIFGAQKKKGGTKPRILAKKPTKISSSASTSSSREASQGPSASPSASRAQGLDTGLLSCVVCEDKSSGLHFGRFICGACKKFFLQSTQGKKFEAYECDNKGTQDCGKCIVKTRKKFCLYCRYQKCLKRGLNIYDIREPPEEFRRYIESPEPAQDLEVTTDVVVDVGMPVSSPERNDSDDDIYGGLSIWEDDDDFQDTEEAQSSPDIEFIDVTCGAEMDVIQVSTVENVPSSEGLQAEHESPQANEPSGSRKIEDLCLSLGILPEIGALVDNLLDSLAGPYPSASDPPLEHTPEAEDYSEISNDSVTMTSARIRPLEKTKRRLETIMPHSEATSTIDSRPTLMPDVPLASIPMPLLPADLSTLPKTTPELSVDALPLSEQMPVLSAVIPSTSEPKPVFSAETSSPEDVQEINDESHTMTSARVRGHFTSFKRRWSPEIVALTPSTSSRCQKSTSIPPLGDIAASTTRIKPRKQIFTTSGPSKARNLSADKSSKFISSDEWFVQGQEKVKQPSKMHEKRQKLMKQHEIVAKYAMTLPGRPLWVLKEKVPQECQEAAKIMVEEISENSIKVSKSSLETLEVLMSLENQMTKTSKNLNLATTKVTAVEASILSKKPSKKVQRSTPDTTTDTLTATETARLSMPGTSQNPDPLVSMEASIARISSVTSADTSMNELSDRSSVSGPATSALKDVHSSTNVPVRKVSPPSQIMDSFISLEPSLSPSTSITSEFAHRLASKRVQETASSGMNSSEFSTVCETSQKLADARPAKEQTHGYYKISSQGTRKVTYDPIKKQFAWTTATSSTPRQPSPSVRSFTASPISCQSSTSTENSTASASRSSPIIDLTSDLSASVVPTPATPTATTSSMSILQNPIISIAPEASTSIAHRKKGYDTILTPSSKSRMPNLMGKKQIVVRKTTDYAQSCAPMTSLMVQSSSQSPAMSRNRYQESWIGFYDDLMVSSSNATSGMAPSTSLQGSMPSASSLHAHIPSVNSTQLRGAPNPINLTPNHVLTPSTIMPSDYTIQGMPNSHTALPFGSSVLPGPNMVQPAFHGSYDPHMVSNQPHAFYQTPSPYPRSIPTGSMAPSMVPAPGFGQPRIGSAAIPAVSSGSFDPYLGFTNFNVLPTPENMNSSILESSDGQDHAFFTISRGTTEPRSYLPPWQDVPAGSIQPRSSQESILPLLEQATSNFAPSSNQAVDFGMNSPQTTSNVLSSPSLFGYPSSGAISTPISSHTIRYWPCPDCSEVCDFPETLEAHIRGSHDELTACAYCALKLDHHPLPNGRKHTCESHQHKCKICSYSTDKIENIRSHYQSKKHKDKKRACMISSQPLVQQNATVISTSPSVKSQSRPRIESSYTTAIPDGTDTALVNKIRNMIDERSEINQTINNVGRTAPAGAQENDDDIEVIFEKKPDAIPSLRMTTPELLERSHREVTTPELLERSQLAPDQLIESVAAPSRSVAEPVIAPDVENLIPNVKDSAPSTSNLVEITSSPAMILAEDEFYDIDPMNFKFESNNETINDYIVDPAQHSPRDIKAGPSQHPAALTTVAPHGHPAGEEPPSYRIGVYVDVDEPGQDAMDPVLNLHSQGSKPEKRGRGRPPNPNGPKKKATEILAKKSKNPVGRPKKPKPQSGPSTTSPIMNRPRNMAVKSSSRPIAHPKLLVDAQKSSESQKSTSGLKSPSKKASEIGTERRVSTSEVPESQEMPSGSSKTPASRPKNRISEPSTSEILRQSPRKGPHRALEPSPSIENRENRPDNRISGRETSKNREILTSLESTSSKSRQPILKMTSKPSTSALESETRRQSPRKLQNPPQESAPSVRNPSTSQYSAKKTTKKRVSFAPDVVSPRPSTSRAEETQELDEGFLDFEILVDPIDPKLMEKARKESEMKIFRRVDDSDQISSKKKPGNEPVDNRKSNRLDTSPSKINTPTIETPPQRPKNLAIRSAGPLKKPSIAINQPRIVQELPSSSQNRPFDDEFIPLGRKQAVQKRFHASQSARNVQDRLENQEINRPNGPTPSGNQGNSKSSVRKRVFPPPKQPEVENLMPKRPKFEEESSPPGVQEDGERYMLREVRPTTKNVRIKIDKWTVKNSAVQLPNADAFMPMRHKINPEELSTDERRAIKGSLNRHFIEVAKRFHENPDVNYVFVTDSLLETLNEEKIVCASVMRACFPILPRWAFDKIRTLNFSSKDKATIICCLGFDLLVYSSQDEPDNVIENLNRQIRKLLETLMAEYQGKLGLEFIFITIPEIGFFETQFKRFNELARNMVDILKNQFQNDISITTLDWAQNVADQPVSQMDTVNKRIAILFGQD